MHAPISGKYELLDQIVEDFAARFRRGERPALTEYLQRYPELADDIREVLPAVVEVERAEPAVRLPAAPLRQVGDYRVLREIGRGGMGVVYEAEQSSLGRHVALKVLPLRAGGDGKAVERFKREARAAAKLHHTNIVPVFEVGEDGDVCFYAMQFIQGHGLDMVITELRLLRSASERKKQAAVQRERQTYDLPAEELARSMLTGRFRAHDLTVTVAPESPGHDSGGLPPPADNLTMPQTTPSALLAGQTDLSTAETDRHHYFEGIARIGRQTAAALAHAHERGIVHRDIKPSNLLLDASGIVWVTDFGLAKTEEGDLTSPGDILGTIRYMAPERFTGHSDPRSDVYALGVTLYELLVLRPAFEGCDRATLMEEIASNEPPRPRTLDRRIPRDLETIVMKAIAKDPARRYATAEAMADDLGRFLENRPIEARRSSSTERLWRWCRRNPAVAGLLTFVFALLLCVTIGSIAVAIYMSRQSAALASAEGDRTAKIYETYQARLAQAYANRSSQRAGQRFVTLEAVREAAQMVRERQMPPERLDELRNLAIAALTLPDLRTLRSWKRKVVYDWWDTDRDVQVMAGRTSDRRVSVIRIDTDEVIAQFTEVDLARLSPNGRFVFGNSSNRFRVWKLPSPGSTPILQGEEYGVAFHPDGRHLLTTRSDGALRLYDLDAPEQQPSTLATLPAGATSMVFDPQGQRLAVTRPQQVDILDARTGQIVVTIPEAGLITPAWHPGGKYLALVSSNGVVEYIARNEGGRDIHIWDMERNKRFAVLRGCPSGGVQVAFTPDGDRLLGRGRDAVLRLWDWRSGKQLLQHSGSSNLNVSPSGRLLVDNEEQWHLLEFASGLEYRTFMQHSAEAERIVYREPIVHPGGRLLAVNMSGNDAYSADQLLLLFDLDTGDELAAIPQARFRIVFQADGTLLTNGSQGLLRWPIRQADGGHWHVGPPKLLYPRSFVDMAADRNGDVIGQANGRGALLVRPGKGLAFLGPHGAAQHIGISPDGRYAVTGINDGEAGVKLWDIPTRRLLKTFPMGVHCAGRFSPDGRLLFIRGTGGCEMVKVGSWETALTGRWNNVAFSPDGSLFATDPRLGLIQLVDLATGRELARLEDPDRGAMDLVFTPDGTKLVTSSMDAQAIHVWDLRAIREQLAKLRLDWDAPPYPHAERRAPSPLHVTVDLGFVDARQSLGTQTVRLALNPLDYEAYLERGLAYAHLQKPQPQRAVADFTMALALLPANHIRRAEALLYRGSHGTLKDFTAARADLQQIADDDLPLPPELTGIAAMECNTLAWHYVAGPEAERDPPKALALIRKAIKLAPDDSNFVNTRGVVHYRLGQYPQAVEWLERSLRESRGEAAAFDLFFLAMCHAKQGDAARAKECYDRAVRWVQENQRAIKLQPTWGAELRSFQAEADAALAAGAVE